MGFIVEGFHDELKVKEVMPNAVVVVTKGTRINGRVKMDIQKALLEYDKVFLLTDPDEAGDQLAQMIRQPFLMIERIALDREQCLCYWNRKLKIGVEHCDTDYLRKVLHQSINKHSLLV